MPALTDEPIVEQPLIEHTTAGPPLVPGPPLVDELPPEPPDGRSLDRAIAIGLIVLLLFVALVLGAAYLLSRDDGNGDANGTTQSTAPAGTTPVGTVPATVGVASVVGAKRAAAESRLRAQGLKPTARSRPSTKPEGTVIDQRPAAGSKLPRGSAVALVVSGGPRQASVPKLVGLTAADASAKVTAAGLEPRTRKQSSRKQAGTVISQNPTAGTHLDRGAPVVLVVAVPVPKVAVPDLANMERIDAKLAVRKAGLIPQVHLVPSEQKAGTVVAQFPRAGSQVARGSRVRINVARERATSGGGTGGGGTTPTHTTTTSTTPTRTAVPDVTSLDEQEATRELQDAGFRVATTDQDTPEQSEDGLVLDQTPAGGARAADGSTVTIVVGRYTG